MVGRAVCRGRVTSYGNEGTLEWDPLASTIRTNTTNDTMYDIGGSEVMIRRSDVLLNQTRMTLRVCLSHNATDT